MIVNVIIAVNVPDEVEDISEYLNEATFNATHPEGGDIYDNVMDYFIPAVTPA